MGLDSLWMSGMRNMNFWRATIPLQKANGCLDKTNFSYISSQLRTLACNMLLEGRDGGAVEGKEEQGSQYANATMRHYAG